MKQRAGKALHLTVGMQGLPWSSPVTSVGPSVPGLVQPCCWHTCSPVAGMHTALLLACMQPHQSKHCSQLCLQSRRASPEPAEAAAHICSGGHTSCTALTLLLLIYSPAFFFLFPPPPSCRRISLRQDLPVAVSACVVPSAEF